jgi:hypothetical protein
MGVVYEILEMVDGVLYLNLMIKKKLFQDEKRKLQTIKWNLLL